MTGLRFEYLMAFALMLAGCRGVGDKDEGAPNIVFILADDLGWNQLSCYGGPYHTPNIDALAGQGMRFTQAYASAAVCSPTRAAIHTSKYPARLQLTDFIKGQPFPDSLLRQPDWRKYLPLEEVTLAEVLKKNGYRTAFFGKWHLSPEKKPPESLPFNPDKQGFDKALVTYKPHSELTDPEHDPHNVDSITTRALDFLDKQEDGPFFLFISHNAIHDPLMESKARIDRYLGDSTLEQYRVRPELAAMVERLDIGVDKVLDKIDQLDLYDNTVVIFYSDNGGKERYASQRPFRRGKGWLYEGGVRVPLIFRYPPAIQPHSTSDQVLSSIDLFPTIMDLVGLENIDQEMDGKSFAKQLKGAPSEDDRTLYWHYPHYHRGSGMRPASALRDGDYKLIEWHEALLTGIGEPYELYDLNEDPGELNNLVHSKPRVFSTLRDQLEEWKTSVKAQMPVVRK